MARFLILVEGETEETFVDAILAPHLLNFGHFAGPRIIGNARLRSRRGGIRPWPPIKNDIVHHLRRDPQVVVTTMVDYYGLPQSGNGAWPGRSEASNLPFASKSPAMVRALYQEVHLEMGDSFNAKRFIPFVMMHEFEALLFSDSGKFAQYAGKPQVADKLQAVRKSFAGPEEINDSPFTAPSKRIEQILPGYEKPLHGNVAILEIGLPQIRKECPIFDAWVSSLEAYV